MREDRKVEFPDMRPENAALYIRVARESDEAVDIQEGILRRYAEKQGYRNALIYVDNGYSGCTMDRPALKRLNDDIADGRVRRVIVKDLARIGRKWYDVMEWLNDLYHNDCAVLSVDDCIDDEVFLYKNELFQAYCNYFDNTSRSI